MTSRREPVVSHNEPGVPRDRKRIALMLTVVWSDRFEEHVTPPGHPERLERADVMRGVALTWRDRGGAVIEPRNAVRDDLVRVHDAAYLDALDATRGRPVALDADTFTSSASVDVATLAAGAALTAVDDVLDGRTPTLALVRPPGHHAERDRAMGFCLLNNVAIGAARARALGCSRVAIVDIDVHHGNGTQHIFYDDPSVLYLSVHQYPYYPGTGAADEVGRGQGQGMTVNVPLASGATDADYRVVFDAVVEPVLESFAPELLLVSAGYDAHERDPLATMRVTTAGYLGMLRGLKAVAHRVCGGRLVAITEGGYDLVALRECLLGTLDVLGGTDARAGAASIQLPIEGGDAVDDRRGHRAAAAVRQAQRAYWPTL